MFVRTMKIDHTHNLTDEEAYERINSLLSDLQKQYSDSIKNLLTEWNPSRSQMDFSMEIMKFAINGVVYLSNSQVTLDAKIPLMARPFSGRIESIIRQELKNKLS